MSHIFTDNIGLDIDACTGAQACEQGLFPGERDDGDATTVRSNFIDCKGYAIEGDRAFGDDFRAQRGGDFYKDLPRFSIFDDPFDLADAVDVSLHNMSAKTSICGHGAL